MSDRVPIPQVDKNGVPWCDEDNCPFFDGKRCEATGFRPSTICEPAVIDMAADLAALRAKVRCASGEHRAAGGSMSGACADCGVEWGDIEDGGAP